MINEFVSSYVNYIKWLTSNKNDKYCRKIVTTNKGLVTRKVIRYF